MGCESLTCLYIQPSFSALRFDGFSIPVSQGGFSHQNGNVGQQAVEAGIFSIVRGGLLRFCQRPEHGSQSPCI